jgi:signal peptidase II
MASANLARKKSTGRDWKLNQRPDSVSSASEGAILDGIRVARKAGWWVLPCVAVLTLAADQFTKYLVVSNLELYESWVPIPALARWFDIHYVANTGAAFGLFQNGGLFFVIVAIVVSLVILFYYRYLPDGQWLIRVSLGLQLGGALGNLIDRLRVGHVIDFLNFQVWPVFNVADSSIVCGVLLLAFLLLREDRDERKKSSAARGARERIS